MFLESANFLPHNFLIPAFKLFAANRLKVEGNINRQIMDANRILLIWWLFNLHPHKFVTGHLLLSAHDSCSTDPVAESGGLAHGFGVKKTGKEGADACRLCVPLFGASPPLAGHFRRSWPNSRPYRSPYSAAASQQAFYPQWFRMRPSASSNLN